MHARAFAARVFALAAGSLILASHAHSGGARCWAACAEDGGCRTSDQSELQKRPWWIENCDDPHRSVASGTLMLRYISKRTPIQVSVRQGEKLVSAFGRNEPDPPCGWWLCIATPRPTAIPGTTPSGPPDQSSSSTGAEVGLPFGRVLLPARGLSLSTGRSDESGTLTIEAVRSGFKKQVAIRNGVAELPAGTLASDEPYRYRWNGSELQVEGQFKTSRDEFWEYIPGRAAGMGQLEDFAGADLQWRRIEALISNGFRWNAAMEAQRMERR